MNSQKILDIFKVLKAQDKTIIISTHDSHFFDLSDQMLDLEDGRLRICHE
jgi:ABC-type siderophore export system fused ATPase/permease subunit